MKITNNHRFGSLTQILKGLEQCRQRNLREDFMLIL